MEAAGAANTIDFFRTVFTVILALALSEGFRQFVADTRNRPATPKIYWDRFPALLIFLFLIFPFFHGMNRYFYMTYHYDDLRGHFPLYDKYLVFDGISFTMEAAIFFIMSRSFPETHWRRYFLVVLALLVVDSAWCIGALTHGAPVHWWLVLNVFLGTVLLLIFAFDKRRNSILAPWSGAIATFICMVVGYWLDWKLYFP